jgi:hypothetical protein
MSKPEFRNLAEDIERWDIWNCKPTRMSTRFSQDEAALLEELAKKNWRNIQLQVTALLINGLKKEGYLPINNEINIDFNVYYLRNDGMKGAKDYKLINIYLAPDVWIALHLCSVKYCQTPRITARILVLQGLYANAKESHDNE